MTKTIRIRESIALLKENEYYTFVFTNTRKIKKIKFGELYEKIVLNSLNETTLGELSQNLNCPIETIEGALLDLENEGILDIKEEENIPERIKKQVYFINELTKSWNETLNLEKKIENTKITLFGVGGIGTWMINGLYQMNFKNVTIVDPDKIEESNLNRQLFFTSKDIGRYKVDVIKERLNDINIKTSKEYVSEEQDLTDLIRFSDFLINCTDSPSVQETTKIIDLYAQKYKIPYCVSGGYNLHLGMVGPIIVPGVTATFEDFLRYQKENDPLKNLEKIKDVEQSGNIGPIVGVIANLQLLEIFKHIIQKGDINYNKFLEIDFLNSKTYERHFN